MKVRYTPEAIEDLKEHILQGEKELSKIIKDCISYDYKKRPYIKTINKRINKLYKNIIVSYNN